MAIDITKFRSEGITKAPHTRKNYHLYEKLKAKNAALSREEIGDLVGIPLKHGWQDGSGKKVWALLKNLRMDGKIARRYVNDTEYFAIVGGDIKAEDFGTKEKEIVAETAVKEMEKDLRAKPADAPKVVVKQN